MEIRGKLNLLNPLLSSNVHNVLLIPKNRKSSKTMLAPLVQKYPSVSAYFYHTPVLRGLKKKLMPTKYAETMGVQHCKVYLFDDRYG